MTVSGLEGEAKRNILILDETKSKRPEILFQVLSDLYGDKRSIAAIHLLCFSHRQDPEGEVANFSLRLQGLFQKLRKRDPTGQGETDFRDQFVDSVFDRHLRRELKAVIPSTPTMAFSEIE